MREILERRVSPSALAAVLVLALVIAGQLLQSKVHLNHDVSYFVHFDRWLLQGRALGQDLFDGNLPMAWFVFMPAAALAEWHVLSEPAALRLVFWVYFAVACALSALVLSHLPERDKPAALGWVGAFVLAATLAPGFSFGQREHACVLLAMPYLANAAARLDRKAVLGPRLCVLVGVLAGVAFALKPYFLAVPALIELALLVRLGWRSLFSRIESLVLAGTVLLYVILCWALLRDYLGFVIGWALSTYWAYDTVNTQVVLTRLWGAGQAVVFGCLIAIPARRWTSQHTVLLLATVGFGISYWVQAKGYVYHAYPVLVTAIAFLGVCLMTTLEHALRMRRKTVGFLWNGIIVLAVLLAVPPLKRAHDGVVGWYFNYNIAWGRSGTFRQAVIDTVNKYAPTERDYFYAFSTHPFPGFPTASYARADWTGRSIVQPFTAAIARSAEVSDPAMRANIERAAAYQKRMVVEDFQRRPPALVFVERGRSRLGLQGAPFDDLTFHQSDPEFRRLWSNYRELEPMGPLRVFVLRTPVAPGSE